MNRFLFRQTEFNLLGVMLILSGLFLPWYAVGDPFSMELQPLVLTWNITFTQTGGRIVLPSLEQNIPIGFASLFGVIFLILLGFRKASTQVLPWANLGAALCFLVTSIYYIASIWKLYTVGEKIGHTPPGFGLYIFFLGSVILLLVSLRTLRREAFRHPI